jgi:hypothetical protein
MSSAPVDSKAAASFFKSEQGDGNAKPSASNVSTDATFGEVLAMHDGMLMVRPELGMSMTAKPGVIITLPAECSPNGEAIDACLLFERFGLYFAELLATESPTAAKPFVGQFAELKGWKDGKIEKLVVDTGLATGRGLLDFQGTPITQAEGEDGSYFAGSGRAASTVVDTPGDDLDQASRFRPVFGEPPLQGHRAKVSIGKRITQRDAH